MARKGLNPNAAVVAPTPRQPVTATDWKREEDLAADEAVRAEDRATADALDATMTAREANARREVPQTRTDALNPRKDRAFRSPGTVRPMLSSNIKKDLSRSKTGWEQTLPKTNAAAMRRTVSTPQNLEDVNSALRQVKGRRSELPPAINRRVSQVDRAIQSYEQTNERTHIVYAVLRAPRDHPSSRAAVRRRLDRLSNQPENDGMTVDGYIPATHNLGTISDGPEMVMEIRTSSGAYLGTSDTTPDASHILGRGRRLRPVGVNEVTYTRPDGSTGTRTVVQMQDITDS